MLDVWGVLFDLVYEIGISNIKGTYKIESVFSILTESLGFEFKPAENDMMVITSACNMQYGASAMLDTEYFNLVSKDLDADLLILPSSIHEVIVLPIPCGFGLEGIGYFQDMIRTINCNEVSPDEVLSDHPYFYVRDKGEITQDYM